MSEKELLPAASENDAKYHRFIQAQAHVAYSKANRNSAMEIEDYVALGYEVLEIAKKTWRPDQNTKFNTYFTLLLQNKFYKVIASTHRKKRGGAGNKAEDSRRGKGARWENGEAEAQAVQHVSLTDSSDHDDSKGYGLLQVAAPQDNSAEYDLLIEQVGKQMPPALRAVYKQMVAPDEALIALAVKRVDSRTDPSKLNSACVIDTKMMAQYLGMDLPKLRMLKRRVQGIVAKQMGVQI
jgi:hypothetical protein